MTSLPPPHTRTLVWDASALHHAAKADRLDVLGDIASQIVHAPSPNVTTAAVVEELSRNDLSLIGQEWLEIVHVDGLDELVALSTWVGRVSSERHDRGEATVLAWAETHHGIAIIDDADARAVARRHKRQVHGSLWVISEGLRAGHVNGATASCFADVLIQAGARYPFTQGQFLNWAKKNGLT